MKRPVNRAQPPPAPRHACSRPYRGRVVLMLVSLWVATGAALVAALPRRPGDRRRHPRRRHRRADGDPGRCSSRPHWSTGAPPTSQTYLINWVGQRALQDLRLELFEHLQRLSIGFYSRNKTGVLISRITNDVQALDQLVTEGIVHARSRPR